MKYYEIYKDNKIKWIAFEMKNSNLGKGRKQCKLYKKVYTEYMYKLRLDRLYSGIIKGWFPFFLKNKYI